MTKPAAPLPRVTYRIPSEAADSMGLSDEIFNREVRPHVKVVKLGRFEYVGHDELCRYVERRASRLV